MKNGCTSRLRGGVRRLVSSLAAGALAAGMVPAAAFGAVDTEGTTWYTLPEKPVAFDHTDADVNGNTGNYHYLSVAIASPGYTESTYYVLGINDVTATKDLPNKTAVENGRVKSNVGKIGIMGTAANVNPDEYLYNYACYLNGAEVESTSYTSSGNIASVKIGETEYANFPRDIYMEVDMVNKARTAKVNDYNYAFWVGLENMRENRPRTTPYDPTFLTWSTDSGGTYKLTKGLYTVAGIADKVISESATKDADGNTTYGLATRYAKGPETYKTVQKYEDLAKASQYYLISQFATGKIKKAVAGVICGYDKDTGNYAVRILETGVENDKDSNSYGGRLSNAVAAIADDITTRGLEEAQKVNPKNNADEAKYVKWYTPKQLVENCEALLVSDGTGGYLATAGDGERYSVTSSAVDASENLKGLIDAQVEAAAAGKSYADICYRWPKHVFNVFYAQGCENVIMSLVSACFLYPSEFDLTNAMALWARDVWHISAGSLQDIVTTTCYSVSTSRSQTQLGKYTEDGIKEVQAKLNAGNVYYINHQKEIDAMHDGNIATYDIEALKARTDGWKQAAPTAAATPKAQSISAKNVAKSFKAAKKTKKLAAKKTFKLKASAKTAVTFTKKSGNAKITVSKDGKVTVKKGLKKGTYTVKIVVSAKKTASYKATTKNLTVKVKIK